MRSFILCQCLIARSGILHRDIKGANVLVDSDGVCKLADFGAAKQIQHDLLSATSEACHSLRGTPYWMAPEVIKQTGHGRPADIWSLGCTMIEMLTAKPPWSHFTSQVTIACDMYTRQSIFARVIHFNQELRSPYRFCTGFCALSYCISKLPSPSSAKIVRFGCFLHTSNAG